MTTWPHATVDQADSLAVDPDECSPQGRQTIARRCAEGSNPIQGLRPNGPHRARHLPRLLEQPISTARVPFPPLSTPRVYPLRAQVKTFTAGARHTLGASAAQHKVSAIVLATIMTLVGLVHAWGMWDWPAWFNDEGTYAAQAWSVQFKGALEPYTYWYDHPPLGWIQIAGFTTVTGAFEWAPSAIAAGRVFMLVAAMVSVALIWVLARRLEMRRGSAAVAALLFSLSPLALFYQRQVFLDNIEVMWVLAAFVLALSPRRRLWAFAGSGGCLALAALSKETALLLLPGLALLVWQRVDHRTRAFCLSLFTAFLVLGGGTYLLFAALRGELLAGPGHDSIEQAVRFQLLSRGGSGSVFDPASPAHAVLSSWLFRDSWLPLGGLASSVPLLVVRRLRPIAVTVAVQALLLLRHGYLPNPYVIAALPFCALTLAGLGDVLWHLRPGDRALAKWSSSRMLDVGRRIGPVLAVACLAAFTAGVAPSWVHGDVEAVTTDAVAPYRKAETWALAHIPAHERLIVDSTMWVDLAAGKFGTDAQPGGFYSSHVVWYSKLDRDPAVKKRFPDGWRDFGYIIATPSMRRGAEQDRSATLAALRNSVPVAHFGDVQVRRIDASR